MKTRLFNPIFSSSVNKDIKTKETIIMKLLNHILQPTIYSDIRECSRDFVLENNVDKFIVSVHYSCLFTLNPFCS